uniref:Carboxylic ester hydrolase n=1 Tax=Ditylenchus dipsaci TaxID=166011 RepID=A0A915CN30_9BILA
MWLLGISVMCSVFFFTACAKSDSSSMPTPPSLPGPIVEVEQGKLEGFTFDLEFWPHNLPQVDNTTRITSADIFLGIPYAQPPVDQLRLEKPLPPNKWDGVLQSTEVASSCVPLHLLASFDYSEDCLFVNVFRPSASHGNSKVKYPVLVFIHGGGFSLGGSFVEGYRNLSHNFVSQGIVVVTIQYRLGLFGFFSDGSAELPGNLGLWDQAQALVWIQKNIKVFGGDPDNVTVWGQSAGSASVSMLSISRHSRDLFYQTIQQSGSWLSPWALNNRVVNTSVSSANILNCSTESSQELKQCMKDLPLEDIVFGIAEIEMVRGEFEIIVYNPRPDGDFFDAPFEQLTKESPKKPTIIGFTTDEGMFLTTEYPDSVFAFQSPLTVEDNKLFGEKDLIKRIQDKVMPKSSKGSKKSMDSIKKEVIQFYTGATTKAKEGNSHSICNTTLSFCPMCSLLSQLCGNLD